MIKGIHILLLLTPILSFSQSINNWNETTTKTLESIKSELEPEQILFFKSLISKRENYKTQKRIDTTNATIKIIEGYNFSDQTYGVIEKYLFENNQKCIYENDLKEFGYSFDDYEDFIESSLKKSSLDSIYPRKYTAVFGCSPSNRTIQKSKKIQRKAEKEGVISETYVKIETLIDNRTGKISVTFLIPKPKKREVRISYGPFYSKTKLEYWLN